MSGSGLEGWGDSARGRSEAWGRASGNGQVYQSGGDQHVTHVYVTSEARGQAAHEARERADVVVQVLARAVGEWAARCEELEEQARRAKAEGRAEAHAEFAEKLRDAELRVIQAQRMMREAEEERAKAEALLTQAQQELARQRRTAERERAANAESRSADMASERQETGQFAQLMEQAEAELGAVRDKLRLLSDEMHFDGGEQRPTVVQGQVVDGEAMDDGVRAPGPTFDELSYSAGIGNAGRAHSPLGRVIGTMLYFAAGLPLPIVGSAIHTMYSAETPPAIVWGIVFVVCSVWISVMIGLLLVVGVLDEFSWSEGGLVFGCGVHVFAGIALFVAGIVLNPQTVPVLTQAGRIVVEYLGPL